MSPSRRSFLRWSGVALAGTAGCLGLVGSPGTQVSIPDDAPDALRWVYKTTDEVHGSPTVTEDAVYVPNGRLFALNHDGTMRWSVATADRVSGPPEVADAVYFTDAALGDRDDAIRAVEFDGNERWAFEAAENMQLLDLAGGLAYVKTRVDGSDFDYELYAVNTETGEREWTAEIGVSREFAVADGSAYVVNDRAVRALATGDGAKRWQWRANVDSSSAPRDWTLAGVRDETVVVAGESSVVALDAADGTERWASTDEDVTVTDAVLRDDTVYVTESDAVSAFDFEDGAHRWRSADHEGKHSYFAGVADGAVYTSDRNGVVAVDADTGETKWTWADGDDASDALTWDDALYVTGDSRIAAIGTDGEERWRFRMKNADSTLGRPHVSDLGGYAGSGDGTVYAFET